MLGRRRGAMIVQMMPCECDYISLRCSRSSCSTGPSTCSNGRCSTGRSRCSTGRSRCSIWRSRGKTTGAVVLPLYKLEMCIVSGTPTIV
eukprot:6775813-Pyramimonas_sp.AAC.1